MSESQWWIPGCQRNRRAAELSGLFDVNATSWNLFERGKDVFERFGDLSEAQ